MFTNPVGRVVGKPEEDFGLAEQAVREEYLGHWRKVSEYRRRGRELARQRQLTERAAGFLVEEAVGDALLGNCRQARARAQEAVSLDVGTTTLTVAGVAVALCGDATRAQEFSDQAYAKFPLDTLSNAVRIPSVRAAIELRLDRSSKAVEHMNSSSSAGPTATYSGDRNHIIGDSDFIVFRCCAGQHATFGGLHAETSSGMENWLNQRVG